MRTYRSSSRSVYLDLHHLAFDYFCLLPVEDTEVSKETNTSPQLTFACSLTWSSLRWPSWRLGWAPQSCSSPERRSHSRPELWRACQHQETEQFLHKRRKQSDSGGKTIFLDAQNNSINWWDWGRPCTGMRQATASPIAMAVFPVPGWPAISTALLAMRPSLIISRMIPAALREASWPTIPWDTCRGSGQNI